MRAGTRVKAAVQPVSVPSSRTETWGKLPGSPARLCSRYLVLVSWSPACVGGPGFWPSVPVLSVCRVASCAPGLVASSGFVSWSTWNSEHYFNRPVYLVFICYYGRWPSRVCRLARLCAHSGRFFGYGPIVFTEGSNGMR